MVSQVSVLLPCYNTAVVLPQTLDSLLAQSHPDFEIVAVDDGSEDDTLQVLRGYAEKDRRLRVVSLPHGGIIPALNQGLENCSYEYVARMDADDLAHPQRLLKQAAYLDQHQEIDIASCLVEGFPPDEILEGFQIYMEWLNSLTTHEEICREIFVESPLAHPSVMFKKSVVIALSGYQERGWAEDYDLWLRLFLAGHRFGKVEEVLLSWRDHPERLTRTDSRYSLENFIRAKAYYLVQGPLRAHDAVIIWGSGMMGKRLSKHLLRLNVPIRSFVDVDPKKIGNTRRGFPILSPKDLVNSLSAFQTPVVLVAVRARGARQLIRGRLEKMGLVEGQQWWSVA